MSDGWYQAAKPRAVDGGLKAHTARGAIGASWWSRRFLDVLESFAMGNRLTRGRNYARKGQVISLDVAAGTVSARVQGTRATPYRVTIGVAPFPELVWARAEIALAEQALPSAKLLAGEVPPELEEIFAAAGAPLFPTHVNDLDQQCSCPDWKVPCKHLAATFYLLAEAFDADPFLVLRWRGRGRDELLARLRELRGSAAPAEASAAGQPPDASGAGVALGDLPAHEIEPGQFWLPGPPLPLRPATLRTEPDLLLRQLPEPVPVLGGKALSDGLAAAYQRFATGE